MSYAEPVTAEERLHLDLDDSHVHMHVGGAFLFEHGPLAPDGAVDIDRLRAFVESRLYRIPRYRQRLVRTPLEGRQQWIDDGSFNIRYHVRHTHLPHPGDERQMKRLCGQIASQRLDPERPLWELHVVEGLEANRFALVAKVHQSITAGLWGIGLIEALLAPTPETEFESGPIWLPRPSPDGSELLRRALRRRVAAPALIGRALLDAASNPAELREQARHTLAGLRDPSPASATPLNRPIGPHRRFDWLTLEAGQEDLLAERYETSAIAITVATVAGALGRFFKQRGITAPDQRDLRFRVALPEHAGGLCSDEGRGETLSWMVAELPIAESDPVRRLERVHAALADPTHVSYRLFASVSEWLWTGVSSAPARRQLGRGASNLTITDLSGPQADLFLLGARMTAAYPLLPLVAEQAVRLAVYRYGGALHFGINSDWDLVPDLHDLVDFIAVSFRELCDAADLRAA
jgi:WS/DGAT/MGAT family acyltransferase